MLSAVFGVFTCFLLNLQEDAIPDKNLRTIFICFVLLVGIPVFIHNFRFLIFGEGELLTSTLVNCRVNVIRGGKQRQRVEYRLEGISAEGNKNSFLLRYSADMKAIDLGPITDNTRIIVKYYAKSHSICSVTRQEITLPVT